MSTRREMLRWLAAAAPGVALGCGGGNADTDAGTDAIIDPDTGASDTSPDTALTCDPTSSDATGPFFEEGAPMRTMIARSDEPGERLVVEGQLLSVLDCRSPLADHVLDLWQADANGDYFDAGPEYRLRGKIVTDSEGRFSFESIIPGNYPLAGMLRPAHLHMRVYDPGGGQLLTTQIYFEGDPHLYPRDPCRPPNCNSDDPDRIIRLNDAMISGRPGKTGNIPIIV